MSHPSILWSSLNRLELWGSSLSANKGNPTHVRAQIPMRAPRVCHALRSLHLYCVHTIGSQFKGAVQTLTQRCKVDAVAISSCSVCLKQLQGVNIDTITSYQSYKRSIFKEVTISFEAVTILSSNWTTAWHALSKISFSPLHCCIYKNAFFFDAVFLGASSTHDSNRKIIIK